MEAQSWNEEGEPTRGLSKVVGSSLASVLSILLMSKAGKGLAQATFLEGCLIRTGSEADIQEHSQD